MLITAINDFYAGWVARYFNVPITGKETKNWQHGWYQCDEHPNCSDIPRHQKLEEFLMQGFLKATCLDDPHPLSEPATKPANKLSCVLAELR